MLLGAPLGTQVTGRPGSLAVLASGRSPLGATGGPMIAVRVAAPGMGAGAGGPSLWQNAAPP